MIDSFGAAGEAAIASIAHFDEDYAAGVAHDQIDLSMATAVIAIDKRQAVIDQEATCLGFGSLAAFAGEGTA